MYEINTRTVSKDRFGRDMVEISNLKNLLFVMRDMDYGDKIYPEDQFTPYIKIRHEMEYIGSVRPDAGGTECTLFFDKAGRTHEVSFTDFNYMSIQIEECKNHWTDKAVPSYFRYKMGEFITRYE